MFCALGDMLYILCGTLNAHGLQSKIEEVFQHKDFKHSGVRACLDYLSMNEGLEIHHDGDLPARSGIGSSSAFVVGLLHALYAYRGQLVETKRLAQQAIEIEKDILGEAVGVQDQIMAAHGGIRIIEMGPDLKLSSNQLFLSHDYIRYFESHFLLGYSGISRTGSDFAEEKIQNIKNKKTETELFGLVEIAELAISLIKTIPTHDIIKDKRY
jgi:D-glycero-alpha-D-manno-heptose-7-phosphate kinase